MTKRTQTVDQESPRALVKFLREYEQEPGHVLIIDAYADALDLQQRWGDTPADEANRNALRLACMGLAAYWRDEGGYRDEWLPKKLRTAS